jgi:hypothetical protein
LRDSPQAGRSSRPRSLSPRSWQSERAAKVATLWWSARWLHRFMRVYPEAFPPRQNHLSDPGSSDPVFAPAVIARKQNVYINQRFAPSAVIVACNSDGRSAQLWRCLPGTLCVRSTACSSLDELPEFPRGALDCPLEIGWAPGARVSVERSPRPDATWPVQTAADLQRADPNRADHRPGAWALLSLT